MLIGSGLSASPAQASYMVALAQQVISGVNSVVASGNGSLDLTGLTLGGSDGTDLPLIDSNSGIVAAGRGADRSSVDKGGEK
jgi:hypothetical protein